MCSESKIVQMRTIKMRNSAVRARKAAVGRLLVLDGPDCLAPSHARFILERFEAIEKRSLL